MVVSHGTHALTGKYQQVKMILCPRNMSLWCRKCFLPVSRALGTKTSSCPPDIPSLDVQSEPLDAKPFSEIPGPTGRFRIPLIGLKFHLKPFTNYTPEMFHHILGDMLERYGPVFRMDLDAPSVFIADPKDIATMYRQEGKYPDRPFADLMDMYFKRTGKKRDMTALQGEEWSRLRTPLNRHLMRTDSMPHYLPAQNEVADDFVKMLARGYRSDYPENDDPFAWFVAESVGVVLFNARIGLFEETQSNESREFMRATVSFFKLLKKSVTGETFSYKFFQDKVYKEYEMANIIIEKETERYIHLSHVELERKKRDGTFDPQEPNLLLSLLNEKSLTEEDVSNIMGSMYRTGVDSTGSALHAIFYLLATNPAKQDKLREEVHRVMGRDGPLTKDALNSMPYLRACLKECYRCQFPIIGGTARRLPVDVVFGGYKVPAGVKIYNFNRKILRDNFDQPDDFIPERWLRDEGRKLIDSHHSSWALLPFSVGSRGCIGKRIAEQEMHVGMAKAVQKLEIGLKPESWNTPFDYSLFVKPRRPLRFTFKEI